MKKNLRQYSNKSWLPTPKHISKNHDERISLLLRASCHVFHFQRLSPSCNPGWSSSSKTEVRKKGFSTLTCVPHNKQQVIGKLDWSKKSIWNNVLCFLLACLIPSQSRLLSHVTVQPFHMSIKHFSCVANVYCCHCNIVKKNIAGEKAPVGYML